MNKSKSIGQDQMTDEFGFNENVDGKVDSTKPNYPQV